MTDGEAPSICCPGEDRRHDLVTVTGLPVLDVHRHKGLLRGFIVEPGRTGEVKRKVFWLRNGRLSRVVETEFDLRRVG